MEEDEDKFTVIEDDLLFFVDGKWVRLADIEDLRPSEG